MEALVARLPSKSDLDLTARLQVAPPPAATLAGTGFHVTRPQRANIKAPVPPKLSPIATALPPPREDELLSQQRPGSAHAKPVLPSISSSKTQPHHHQQQSIPLSSPTAPAPFVSSPNVKVPAPFEMDLPPEVERLNAGGPLAIAAFVREKADQYGFLYLAEYKTTPSSFSSSASHHKEATGATTNGHSGTSESAAYNMRIVPSSAIDPNNYYTISAGGVTHVVNAKAEFTPLDRWVQEYNHIVRLLRMKTFSNFRMWKAFATWRKTVVTAKRKERSSNLLSQLFIADNRMRPTLLAVRKLCLSLVDMKLCTIDTSRTYSLSDFLEAQRKQLQSVQNKLGGFREDVRALVLAACKEALAAAGFGEGHGESSRQ